MGQRLNLEIRKKSTNKVIANAYYHWSAYTGSAYELTALAVNFLEKNKDLIKDERLLAIRALEATGAGLPDFYGETDFQRMKDLRKYVNITFAPCRGRNEGIIGCFPDSIKTTEDWAEGTSTIFLEDLTVLFDIFHFYDSVEDIKEWIEDFDEKDAVIFNYDFEHLSIGELREIIDTVCAGKWACVDGVYISEIG